MGSKGQGYDAHYDFVIFSYSDCFIFAKSSYTGRRQTGRRFGGVLAEQARGLEHMPAKMQTFR
jgi:hypothetical protein